MTLEFQCKNVGVVCNASIKADSEDELISLVAEHADHTHGVPELSQTLVNYAKSTVTEVGAGKSD